MRGEDSWSSIDLRAHEFAAAAVAIQNLGRAAGDEHVPGTQPRVQARQARRREHRHEGPRSEPDERHAKPGVQDIILWIFPLDISKGLSLPPFGYFKGLALPPFGYYIRHA